MKKILFQLGDAIGVGFVYLTLCWVLFALGFQLYFVFNLAAGNEEKLAVVEDELTVRIDGRYSGNPKNWFYEEPSN